MCRDKNGSSLAIGEYPRVLELLQSTICKATGWVFGDLHSDVAQSSYQYFRPPHHYSPTMLPFAAFRTEGQFSTATANVVRCCKMQ